MDNNEKMWGGEFGNIYTERQKIDLNKRWNILEYLLQNKNIYFKNVLEVGANDGHNLVGIDCDVKIGLEINKDVADTSLYPMIIASAYNIPLNDKSFDLVFTAGVLIHLEDTLKAMKEIYRVSSKYILSIEYFDDKERKIEYRDGVYCSAKPFDRLWLDNFDLDLVELGNMKDFGLDDGTDFSRNCKYAIFKKP